MQDVEALFHKGTWRLKAITEKARVEMGQQIGGPWQMAAEVFMANITPDKLDVVLSRLRDAGLQTEPDNISSLTDF